MYVSIRIKGHLDPAWQQELEGLQIVHEEQAPHNFPVFSGIRQRSLECSKGSIS